MYAFDAGKCLIIGFLKYIICLKKSMKLVLVSRKLYREHSFTPTSLFHGFLVLSFPIIFKIRSSPPGCLKNKNGITTPGWKGFISWFELP